jgi:hypothetical protein
MNRSTVSCLAPVAFATIFLFSDFSYAQSWRPMTSAPPFLPLNSLLLTDGTVLVQARDPATTLGSRYWWRLSPDAFGDYGNGSWSPVDPLPDGYAPLYYAAAVLANGRVLIEGGEYNGAEPAETTLGALYDPVANHWTPVAPPSGWRVIGDAPSVVLSDGTFMLGSAFTSQQALFDESTLSWSPTGNQKHDINAEEGWSLLPGGRVLTVDVYSNDQMTEAYDPFTGAWASTGSTPVPLSSSFEIGPAILRPDGTVFATGDNGDTAVLRVGSNEREWANGSKAPWVAGPTFPTVLGLGQLDIADGPASLLPNGHVLCAAGPGFLNPPTVFFEFDGHDLLPVANPPAADTDINSFTRLLLLPTGEVLFTDGSADVELYGPPMRADRRWAPEISEAPRRVQPGHTYRIEGTQFNGLSQANAYGDDVQNATNYPLVRIVHSETRHVVYARTHDHSSMGVATGRLPVFTFFDVPSTTERGPSRLTVVANGIESVPVEVWVD